MRYAIGRISDATDVALHNMGEGAAAIKRKKIIYVFHAVMRAPAMGLRGIGRIHCCSAQTFAPPMLRSMATLEGPANQQRRRGTVRLRLELGVPQPEGSKPWKVGNRMAESAVP